MENIFRWLCVPKIALERNFLTQISSKLHTRFLSNQISFGALCLKKTMASCIACQLFSKSFTIHLDFGCQVDSLNVEFLVIHRETEFAFHVVTSRSANQNPGFSKRHYCFDAKNDKIFIQNSFI